MLAIKKQNNYIIKHLNCKGASKNSVDKKGNTVYHYVAITNKDIVKVNVLMGPMTVNRRTVHH